MGRSLSYDVIVAGGGPAGLAAAVAAGRAGARTALIERYGFLGGTATAGLVGTICGLYRTSESTDPEPVNPGFPDQLARRLAVLPGCEPPERIGKVFVLPYSPFAFACLADQIATETTGLEVFLHTVVVGAVCLDRRIAAVRAFDPEGEREIAGRAFVDTTGDAVLARLAGAATTPMNGRRQPPALVFAIQGVDGAALQDGGTLKVLRAVAAGERQGQLPAGCSNLALRRSGHAGEVIVKLTLTGLPTPATAGVGLGAVETEGRRRAKEIAGFLRESVPAFASSFVCHLTPQVGVREGPTVVGRYRLTGDDVVRARSFEDGVARGAWPIELWEEGRAGARYQYPDRDATYDIPLRCLVAQDRDNLFMAGRCLSATHEALASARVIGTCLATGEAAGRAAASAAGQAE